MISDNLKRLIIKNNSKIYTIDANMIARKLGLNNKISMIMEYAILYITELLDKHLAKEEIIKYITNKFNKKGNHIVEANIKALDMVEQEIKLIFINDTKNETKKEYKDIYSMIFERRGNELPVSSFLKNPSGEFKVGTSLMEKRYISSIVPRYISDNCINCGFCSFVCPHSVIRQFLLSQEEYDKSPDEIKLRCTKALGLEDYYFVVAISIKDCTGCGLCYYTCPGKKGVKALTKSGLDDEIKNKEQEVFDYLNTNIKEKNKFSISTIKGSQFKDPKFKYCGACAGCGETSYIKILTQLYGENLVISNATGCSSIYGGSVPSMPYQLPWASSLFEDNAEYGYGMLMGVNVIRNRIKNIMESNMDNSNSELFKKWLDNYDDYEITNYVYNNLNFDIPEELLELKEYIPSRNIWCIGGDGWAYDIGFGGLDHVLAMNDNINILVLDTEMYSNTGGQVSKSSPRGSLASFATKGKKTSKKDLARMMMNYKDVYVATVSLGANMMQLLKVFKEATEYNGPSIVIAYAPCISHGNKNGMSNTLREEELAVKSGYFPLFRRHPINGFILDSKNVDFDLYNEFLESQTRYSSLKKVNPEEYEKLLEQNKQDSIERYNYYKNMSE